MPRFALGIEYQGTHYAGWQTQANARSVQGVVEQRLSQIAQDRIHTVCAGRTDKGVHALMQVIHFDTQSTRPIEAWVRGGNRFLPDDIRICWAQEVPETFDARRRARLRHYTYVIYNHGVRPSLWRHQVSWFYRTLDADLMQAAAQHWIGEHDFSAFRGADCQSHSAHRHVTAFTVQRLGDFVVCHISANAFLQHMIRNMIGVLVPIGRGLQPVTWAQQVLLSRDRQQAGVTAPPQGLYLVGVDYPSHFQLPNTTTDRWLPFGIGPINQ